MKKQFLLVCTLLVLALTLSACGNAGPSTNLNVNMTDFMYDPSNYTVPAGQTITLKLSNNGAVEHEFVIMKYGTDVGADFGDDDEENIYWEVELSAGSSGEYTFTAPSEPGEYQIVCGIPGHFMAGMVGKMIVVAE